MMDSKHLLICLVIGIGSTTLGWSAPLDATVETTILGRLAKLTFASNEGLPERCQTYERHLAYAYGDLLGGETEEPPVNQIQDSYRFISALVSRLSKASGYTDAETKIIADIKRCLQVQQASSGPAVAPQVVSEQFPPPAEAVSEKRQSDAKFVTFSGVGLAKLSLAQHEVKSLTLDKRCERYEEVLREILAGQELAQASKPVLFKGALSSLAARRVPFQRTGQQPFVEPLSECTQKLSAYREGEGEQEPVRRVIAGPNYERDPLMGAEINPVANMRSEFENVQKTIVDHGQDLYAPKQADNQAELKFHKNDVDDEETIDLEVDDDVRQASSNEGGRLYSPSGLMHQQPDEDELYRPSTGNVYDDAHHPLNNEYILDETLEELIRKERDPARRTELELESAKRLNQRLLQQLDDDQYEIGELKEHVDQLKKTISQQQQQKSLSSNNELDDSRFGEMKLLYDQACEREERLKDKYDQLERKYADLEAKRVLERSLDDNMYVDENDDDDDDDDEYDPNEEDERERMRKLNKELEKWDKKEREKQEKQYKKEQKEVKKDKEKAEKAEKKAEKKEKKDKKADKDDEKKVYKSPIDIARKLQSKMKPKEQPEQRCQKYYAILNHPGKVTKDVLKTVAKLRLPSASVTDPEYYNSLAYYAELLGGADHEDAREAADEMKQCLGGDHYTVPVVEPLAHDNLEHDSDEFGLAVDGPTLDDFSQPLVYMNQYVPSKYGNAGVLPDNRPPARNNYYDSMTPRSWVVNGRQPAENVLEIPVESVVSRKYGGGVDGAGVQAADSWPSSGSDKYYDMNPRWKADRKPDVLEIPIESPAATPVKRVPVVQRNSNSYAYAGGSGTGGSAAAAVASTVGGGRTRFSRFPSN